MIGRHHVVEHGDRQSLGVDYATVSRRLKEIEQAG